ncbi:2-oxo acid dehydrogenase subunit E2 [Candidatus Woesearchaeota archaeon]|nr:2-oxo acid dehydrogenase subunit E2 [Candidatus Woesearchaeota archaeon]
MPYEFKFPDVGEGIHEGEIVKWLVKEGDKVKADQPLGEIETDKAIVEMPSPKSGAILKLHVAAGSIIHVGEVMVTILEEHETEEDAKKHWNASELGDERARGELSHVTRTRSQLTKSKQQEAKEPQAKSDVPYTGSVVGFLEEAKEVKPIHTSIQEAKPALQETGIMATPAVRNLAKQLNIDLTKIKGTGADGRITVDDVQKAGSSAKKEEKEEPAAPGIKVVRKYDFFGYIDRVPLHGIKKAVASKMAESIFTAAQVTNMHEADVTELAFLRENHKPQYEKEGIKLTFMPYIVKAVAICLKDHPYLNASLEGDEIVLKKYYNIGIAVDTEEGLLVPVVKGAHEKDIKIIAKEIEKLANDAKTRKVNLMDLKGGSFTVSNLGSVGVEFFTPIINYPESAILGVGRLREKPAVKNGKIEVRKMLPLSLTYDHRIVDGAQAARFVMDLTSRLELCEFE